MQVEEMGLKDTRWVTNGSEALTLLKRRPIDLIICGVSMPEMDALELLEACQEDPQLTEIPFIIMGSGTLLRARALEVGMDVYIVNPVFPDELQEALKKIRAGHPSMPHLGKSTYQGASTMSGEDSKKSAYRNCASCGRRVFVDLLDEQGVCEYCREVRKGESTIPARFVKRRRKAGKKNT